MLFMDTIIVDTSSILFALSKRIDIFERIDEQLGSKPVISKGIINELTELSKDKKAVSRNAAVALKLISSHSLIIDDNEDYPDNWILKDAKKFGKVCTNDTKLRQALRAMSIQACSISVKGVLK